ncbi:lipopolysaccharide export system permease protein [Aquabacterium commune]|uniref:Lipopolysaccharide export system permease protein n=1 Tax=Aquabacterium commune TaxID=70586 RepID=A0A4R6RMS1_9BURK|nr:LPS export ABC transporter permease LptG [Aquabacterium commune]TDP87991.1 lipopolysaccharide export system permease protein [Aquabacterium commune]
MRTVRRLIYRSVASSATLVALAFAALAFFIDFVEESQDLGKNGYTVLDALWTCLLMQVRHIYDLMPIALLIGGILALSRMAQTSEFTILRTGGLGPWRALQLLAGLGLMSALLVAGIGNWAVPLAEQMLTQQHARFSSQQQLTLGRGGTWLREKREVPGMGTHTITVNVGSALSEGEFGLVRIFEFDARGQLTRRLSAASAKVDAVQAAREAGAMLPAEGSVWRLQGVTDTRWLSHERLSQEAALAGLKVIDERQSAALDWSSSLTPLVVSASVLPPESMSAFALWRYTRHLASNAQAAQRYEIQFWKKSFYPLVCLVMIALALPFAYLHARSGSMSLKIFGGIMLGISFVLINHISSHLGLLQNWQPWLAAAAPSLLYLLLSMSVFAWLVRYQ